MHISTLKNDVISQGAQKAQTMNKVHSPDATWCPRGAAAAYLLHQNPVQLPDLVIAPVDDVKSRPHSINIDLYRQSHPSLSNHHVQGEVCDHLAGPS